MDRVQKPVEEIDERCPECGRHLVIRTGRFGRFISCSGFPECRYGRSFVTKTGALCPQCGGDLVERKTRQKRRIFYGCNNYPTCNFAIWERPVPDPCPNCGGLMVVARVGQDPVCYNEVVAVQRFTEEKPRQDGTPTRKVTRKKAPTAKTAASTTTRTARRGSSATRKKSARATAGSNTATQPSRAKERPTIKRGATDRAATTRKKSTSRRATEKRTTKQASSAPGSI